MKPSLRLLAAVLVLGTFAPTPAHAQLGVIIDKIQKMSGPSMFYLGAAYRWGYQPGQPLPVTPIDTATVPGAIGVAPNPYRSRAMGCLSQSNALLGTLDARYYDEATVDRFLANRRRLSRIAERDGVTQQYADIACMQPALLGNAEPDPMGGTIGRFGLYYGWDTRDDRPAGIDVRGVMAQLTWEYLPAFPTPHVNIGVEGGFALHYFFGDIEDLFHPSFPVRLNVHPFARCRGWLLRNFRFGTGVHIVPPFGSGAFDGIYDLGDGWEVPRNPYFVTIDVSSTSLSAPLVDC